jgi:hypothetical protein
VACGGEPDESHDLVVGQRVEPATALFRIGKLSPLWLLGSTLGMALLFLVPGVGEALRVNGTARITADPALRERFTVEGKAPATVVLVTVAEVYMQCAKAIMRSRLWGERARPVAAPSMGELLAAHTGGLVQPAEYDAGAPQRLRETMY